MGIAIMKTCHVLQCFMDSASHRVVTIDGMDASWKSALLPRERL
jgi:hypothetical protein